MGIHDGHREKMRTRIENFGLDSLAEHEILETLLYFTIPRGDTNPTAHKLISTFGSLASVLEAPEEELLAVEGVGPKTARLLTMLPHYSRAYLVSKGNSDRPLSEPEAAGRCPILWARARKRFISYAWTTAAVPSAANVSTPAASMP